MRINDGFFAGQAEDTPEEAEIKYKVAERTPHEKGEFRHAYWAGRVHATWTFSLSGITKYLTIEQLKRYHQRLEDVYWQTLVDMYGEQGAKEFLERVRKR